MLTTPQRQISATLVHRTGSGIRFRTSQVGSEIPSTSRSVVVIVPSGARLDSRLTVNPANPMITGDLLVKWIKERLDPDTTREIKVAEIVAGQEYQIILPNILRSPTQLEAMTRITTPEKSWRNLAQLLDGAESQVPGRRTAIYSQIERDARLSPLVRECFGNQCQVIDCVFTHDLNRVLDKFIAEVHHLEHLSRGGT
ncbi:MAG: hypothetical protein M3Y28_05135, partial [Armatimonadota bacterium]|nr:hypothetical protein [Armatimonadota bacterium]